MEDALGKLDDQLINRDLFIVSEPNPYKAWFAAILVSLILFGFGVALMDSIGLFDVAQDESGDKRLAAAIALVGTLLTSAVALVGTMFKYSIDDRNARQAAVDANRNYALALTAEKRNRIEAAIRAVDLLGENNDEATPNQQVGALLALNSLKEVDLALALLPTLWRSDVITPEVAEIVIGEGIRSPSEDTQTRASTVLFTFADKLDALDTHAWPIAELGWDANLATDARRGLIFAAIRWLLAEISRDSSALPFAAAVLYHALEDPDSSIRGTAGASLQVLAEELPEESSVYAGTEVVSVADIAAKLVNVEADASTDQGRVFAEQIREVFSHSPAE